MSMVETEQYQYDKMLIEQDPFLLEEQRYLDRMKKAHNRQEQHYKKHYDDTF